MATLKDRKKIEAEKKLDYYRKRLISLPDTEKEKLKECVLQIRKYERVLSNIEGYREMSINGNRR